MLEPTSVALLLRLVQHRPGFCSLLLVDVSSAAAYVAVSLRSMLSRPHSPLLTHGSHTLLVDGSQTSVSKDDVQVSLRGGVITLQPSHGQPHASLGSGYVGSGHHSTQFAQRPPYAFRPALWHC